MQIVTSIYQLEIKEKIAQTLEKRALYQDLLNEYQFINVNFAKIQIIKNKINVLEVKRINLNKRLFKTSLVENNEQPSKIFFKMAKKRIIRNRISSFTSNKTIFTNSDEISNSIQEIMKFRYEDRENSNTEDRIKACRVPESRKFFKNSHQLIDNLQLLPNHVSEQEVIEVIKHMGTSSSPGPDSLTQKIYKTFGMETVKLFAQYINAFITSEEDNLPSTSIITAYIVPIPKKKEETNLLLDITKIRMISLINVDLRIIASIINAKIGPMLNQTLHPSIFSIKGKNISHSLVLQKSVISHFNKKKNKNPSILKVDFASAFDYTNVTLLIKQLVITLKKSPIIRAIFNVLNARIASIKINGSLSKSFIVKNGLLQGCPLSSTLYSVYTDFLIRQINHTIKGVYVNNITIPYKTTSFVDDITIFCQDFNDLKIANETIKKFSRTSGSIINNAKTFHTFLKNFKHAKQSNLKDKNFGIFLYPDQVNKIRLFQNNQLTSFKATLEQNKMRDLSLFGKAKIINSLIISKITYYSIFYFYQASWIIRFHQIIRSFLWPSIAHIAIQKLYAPPKYTGIGLINIKLIMIICKLRFYMNIQENFSEKNPFNLSKLPWCEKFRSYVTKNLIILSKYTKENINSSSQLHYGIIIRMHYKNYSFSKIPSLIYSSLNLIKLKPSIKTFVLLLYHESLPVKQRLKFRNILKNQDTYCDLCHLAVEESIIHLLHQCNATLHLKKWMAPFLPNMDNFESLRTFNYTIEDLKKIKLMYTYWFCIWSTRNQI